MTVFDIIGWVGMILILLSYILLSTNKLKNGIAYQSMNLAAAALMAIGLFPTGAWFSFTLQVIWVIIAVITIAKIKVKQKR